MTRILLAFLALLGLAAQAAPAGAQVPAREVEVGRTLPGRLAVQVQAARAIAAISHDPGRIGAVRVSPAVPLRQIAAPVAPTVLIGIDRSAE